MNLTIDRVKTVMPSRSFVLASLLVIVFAPGCNRQAAPEKAQKAGPKAAALVEPAAPAEPADTATSSSPADDPLPLQDMEAADLLGLHKKWTGDFDEIATGRRRFIRALVPMNKTLYFMDGPAQRGVAFESLREFEKVLSERAGKNAVKIKIVIVPTTRNRLLPALAEGYGDIAIGGFSITESRKESITFSEPTMTGVKDLVVTGPGAPAIATIDDLAGKEVHVRLASSYHEDLVALNERLKKEGKAPVVIRETDPLLEDEDVLQMVDAGIIPATIVNDLYARLWAQVYDQLKVHVDLVLRDDGELAWAMRKNTPGFERVVNDFIRTHRVGTMFGNVMKKRYLGSGDRLKNPAGAQDLARFRSVAESMRKYAGENGFDWLVIAAQGYQESQLDQSRKSSAGAIGVMQIKPDTAADMGVHNIDRLENNVQAGVKYLRFMVDRYYKGQPMDKLNGGLFALASYNAGPARVRGLRKKASDMGLNPNVWFGNVELVAGREIGRETVDYVSNIYKYYTAYKAIVAERERRGRTATH